MYKFETAKPNIVDEGSKTLLIFPQIVRCIIINQHPLYYTTNMRLIPAVTITSPASIFPDYFWLPVAQRTRLHLLPMSHRSDS